MKKITGLFLFLSFCWCSQLQAQNKFTVSGYIKDVGTGEELIGASIYVQQLSTGTTTNAYGFYSLTLPEGNYDLMVSYVGYVTQKKSLNLSQNQSLNFEVAQESVAPQPRDDQLHQAALRRFGTRRSDASAACSPSSPDS